MLTQKPNEYIEVFGSTGSFGDGQFVPYTKKSIILEFFTGKFQFGDCQNVCYSRKSGISESGTSENLCISTMIQVIEHTVSAGFNKSIGTNQIIHYTRKFPKSEVFMK